MANKKKKEKKKWPTCVPFDVLSRAEFNRDGKWPAIVRYPLNDEYASDTGEGLNSQRAKDARRTRDNGNSFENARVDNQRVQ